MPGTVLSISCIKSLHPHKNTDDDGAMTISTLWMRNLKHKKVKYLPKGHSILCTYWIPTYNFIFLFFLSSSLEQICIEYLSAFLMKQYLFLSEICCPAPCVLDSHPLVPASSNGLQLPPRAVLWCLAQMAHRDPGTRPSELPGVLAAMTPTEPFSGNCTRLQRTV